VVELENQRLVERFYEKVYKSELSHKWKLVIHCRLTARGASLAEEICKETRKEDI
jgi:hypothetical protein